RVHWSRIRARPIVFPRKSPFRDGREPTQSLVVLPFANLSGDASNDYLGVGVADTLTSDLAKVKAITVVSRAIAAGSATGRDLVRIASDLGVNYIVDGGVQQTNGRLKLTARLVGRDGSVAWGGTYEGTTTDLFSLQNELTRGVSEALEVRLTAAERSRLG